MLRLYAEYHGVDTRGWQRVPWREVPVPWLKPAEVGALRSALRSSRVDGEERAFVLDLLVGTGLRLGELLALRWRDVDLEANLVVVRSGKGSKTRTIPMPEDGPAVVRRAMESLREEFWRRYPKMSLDGSRLIWDPVCRLMLLDVVNLLRLAARRAGLSALATHPHVMRHTYSMELTMAGVPAPVLQRLLGHSNLRTTGRYTQASGADIVDALRRAGQGGDPNTNRPSANTTGISPRPA